MEKSAQGGLRGLALRLAYVLICSALTLGFFVGLRFMIYGINDMFGIGFGLGMTIGVFIGAGGTILEYRERHNR